MNEISYHSDKDQNNNQVLEYKDFQYQANDQNQFQEVNAISNYKIQAEDKQNEQENPKDQDVGKVQTMRSQCSTQKDEKDDKLYLSAPKTSHTYRKFYRSRQSPNQSSFQRNQLNNYNRLNIFPQLYKTIHKIQGAILQTQQRNKTINKDERKQDKIVQNHKRIIDLSKQSFQIVKGCKDIEMQIFLHYNLSIAYLNMKNLNPSFEVSDARIIYHLQTIIRSINSIPRKQPHSIYDSTLKLIKNADFYSQNAKLHLLNSSILLTLANFAYTNNINQQYYSLGKLQQSFWQSTLAIYESTILILSDMLKFMLNNNIGLKTGKQGIPHSSSRGTPRKSIISQQKLIQQKCTQLQNNANYAHNIILDIQLTVQNVKKMLNFYSFKSKGVKSNYKYSKRIVILKQRFNILWDYALVHTLFQPSICSHQTKLKNNSCRDNSEQSTYQNMPINYMNFNEIKNVINPQHNFNDKNKNKNVLQNLQKSLRYSIQAMISMAKHVVKLGNSEDNKNCSQLPLNISRRCVFLCEQYFQQSDKLQIHVTNIHEEMRIYADQMIHQHEDDYEQNKQARYQRIRENYNLKKEQNTRKNKVINMRRQFKMFNNPNLHKQFFRSITFKSGQHTDKQRKFQSLDQKDRKQFYEPAEAPIKKRVKLQNEQELMHKDPITKKIMAIYSESKKRYSPSSRSADNQKHKIQRKSRSPSNKLRKREEYQNRHFTFENTVADIARKQKLQNNNESTPEDAGGKLILLNHKNQRIVRIKQMGY